MENYLESFAKNLTATIAGLLFFVGDLPTEGLNNQSTIFLILTVTVPSLIAGIVTVLIEYFKSKRRK